MGPFYNMSFSIVTKFYEDEMKTVWLREQTSLIWYKFGQFKGHNSGVPEAIELVIDPSQEIMPLSIVTKFHEDHMKVFPYVSFFKQAYKKE